jgi:exonuclease SbcC
MTNILLQDVEITNFRSIRGKLLAPLDAKVVLIHGENGAGKTSLLSAIELALTGRVLSLERADPNYKSQLLHRSADAGRINLRTIGLEGANQFQTNLIGSGLEQYAGLKTELASFFSERCYLPQSLLGQLLRIYQESDAKPDSPLSRFVTELLSLDRIDAIEEGLQPVADLRNLRKTTDLFGQVEFEKARLERVLTDHRRMRGAAVTSIQTALSDLNDALNVLGIKAVDEAALEAIGDVIAGAPEEEELSALADQRRELEAIRREADRGDRLALQADEAALAQVHRDTKAALEAWRSKFDPLLGRLRERISTLDPTNALPPSDPNAFRRDALAQLRAQRQIVMSRAARASQDNKRRAEVAAELTVASKNLETIDREIARIGDNAGGLSSVLAELSSFISNDICPVCDRDYAEQDKGSLSDHLKHKVRVLSASAERLLGLSRNRGDQQLQVERLERETAELAARQLEPKILADLERSAADFEAIVAELDSLEDTTREGTRLAEVETSARRALAEHQSYNLARIAAMATLTEFARKIGQSEPEPTATPPAVVARLLVTLEQRSGMLVTRASARKRGREAEQQARAALNRRDQVDLLIQADEYRWRRNDEALTRAGSVRSDAQKIRAQVEVVRSRIIRREFNDRLNRLWRDLFVRLAPNEPFVPAFKIPKESTHRLQPKLITNHRSGGAGGTPGAMLSAGNLNTAALTLFIALHLTITLQLPWLILDDPVQSMDDIHVAHFAALLRTLSKEQNRQVIVAVHDQQLFEYLKLELSPAFVGDSLITLEVSRGTNRDTLCLAQRLNFHEETALQFAA